MEGKGVSSGKDDGNGGYEDGRRGGRRALWKSILKHGPRSGLLRLRPACYAGRSQRNQKECRSEPAKRITVHPNPTIL